MVAEVPNTGWDPRIHLFRAGREVDIYAVIADHYVVFVDTAATPDDAAMIVEAMRPHLATRRPLVVNTHADYDHAWGNAAFASPEGICPAPIIGHRRTGERLRSPAARAYLEERQRAEPRFASVRLVPPDICFDGRLMIDGGDLELHLLHTPGHVEDHVAVWIPAIRTLLAGDAAEHPFPYVGEHAVLSELCATLEQLRALEPSVVIPCHGGTTDPGLLTRNLAYFAGLRAALAPIVTAGSAPPDWRERPDVDAALGLPFEMVLRNLGIAPEGIADFYRDAHRRAVRATLADLLV
jgi:glyoxylase-like metal-dependent hydrolase (beta-lactamase superfamily II)